MVVMSTTPLRRMRESFNNPTLSQEDMARLAGVTMQTYRNAEIGKNCSYTTATSILNAVNSELQARQQELVKLDQLGLRIV